jgi:myo-inositol-1(or 4)-monophosphatase
VNDFRPVEEAIRQAGRKAAERQQEVLRDIKVDGSILTRIDVEIDRSLAEVVRGEFPEANIIAEEHTAEFAAEREWTFTIDPIDGTDSYSQGMAGWCVAVGILDRELNPAGGIIYAPHWGYVPDGGLFISALPGEKEVTVLGIPERTLAADPGEGTQLMVGSKAHRRYDYSSFPGKIRSIGSTVLHVVAPLIHPAVFGAFLPPCHIWDIAAAHAVAERRGLRVEYYNGEPLTYTTLVHRQPAAHHIIAGTREGIETIRTHFLTRDK